MLSTLKKKENQDNGEDEGLYRQGPCTHTQTSVAKSCMPTPVASSGKELWLGLIHTVPKVQGETQQCSKLVNAVYCIS